MSGKIIFRLLSITVLTLPTVVLAETPLDIGGQRQVFIDGRFVRQPQNVEFVVHRPRKTGQIVIACERPWEQRFGQYHSVLYENKTYHMWYTVYGGADSNAVPVRSIAYARSSDGINWEKPDLGLVEIYGTRKNNIVLGHGFGGIKGATHGCMVFIDPLAPSDQRFRLVSNPQELGRYLHIFSSADGIHWKLTHRNVLKFRSERHHLDSQNVIFRDERIKKYVAYVRRNQRPVGSQGRSIARAESTNLSRFPDVEDCPVVLGFDDEDPMYYHPAIKAKIQVADFYTNGTFRYPWAQDAYYMFPSEYFHYMTFLKDFRKGQPVNAGSLDARFAASRDGISWKRYDRRPFVELGLKHEWDSSSIYMAYGVLPGSDESEMFMYYYGSNTLHGWDRDDQHRERNKRLLRRIGGAPETEVHGISRLVIRRDGFVSIRADYTGGEFLTPLLSFTGYELVLNVNTSAVGMVQVEILDENNKPIPGYTLEDCDQIYTANEINRVVTWNGKSAVAKLTGKPVRLRFVMRDADLYAFQFRYQKSSEK
ncbi:MAG: hypothetical protein GWN67_25095 [Phycisphaerae bacterium]|nr:hypothetical protein [Phycisphaerae bacterium]NIP55412.1 hypothetical protein [Phycisphaerae bacterium]NIS54083.1 hypothetical protein [Phycisphaerae bacterium]NIU11725.1 hypothetical protein [Phycisphaerae bacterium]NIU59540.1 hypothetical protein [Phycisphaerae bacterium]